MVSLGTDVSQVKGCEGTTTQPPASLHNSLQEHLGKVHHACRKYDFPSKVCLIETVADRSWHNGETEVDPHTVGSDWEATAEKAISWRSE